MVHFLNNHRLVILVGLVLNSIFFLRLFYPVPQFFFTPEIMRSDIWYQNYPYKHFLSESLKSGKLPLWTKDIGTGHPILAEGQVGTFFLPNLVMYAVLPTWLAFNLSYVIAFATTFFGCYAFCRALKANQWGSVLAAISFTFGGFMVGHVVHLNLLQSASLLPWIFLFGYKLLHDPKPATIVILALLLSQQFLTGAPQLSLITLFGLTLFIIPLIMKQKSAVNKRLALRFLLVGVFALGLSGVQLIPGLEYAREAGRTEAVDDQTSFPFPPKKLITFLQPFAYGKPSDGSYYQHLKTNTNLEGFFWESSVYVGLVALIFALLAVRHQNHTQLIRSLGFIVVLSLLLSFGNNTPFGSILTLPVFNLFRAPGRYLMLTTFCVSVLAALGFTYMQKKNKNFSKTILIGAATILIASIDMFRFGYDLNPLVPVQKALEVPELAKHVPAGNRVITLDSHYQYWSNLAIQKGWSNGIEDYLYLNNGLGVNSNLIYGVSAAHLYTGYRLKRTNLALDNQATSLLTLRHTELLVSTQEPTEGETILSTVVPPKAYLPHYYLFENPTKIPRVRFVSTYAQATDIDNAQKQLKENPDLATTPIIETDKKESLQPLEMSHIEVVSEINTELVLKTQTDQDAFLILADTFYPGWQAEIDGSETLIYPANLNQRALWVPAGEHTVSFAYKPKSLIQGILLTSVTSTAVILYLQLKRSTLT